jgi:hypothetical protein
MRPGTNGLWIAGDADEARDVIDSRCGHHGGHVDDGGHIDDGGAGRHRRIDRPC